MPQCVMSNDPSACIFVPGINTFVFSTTVPYKLVKALSIILNVNNEGTGVSIG